MSGAASTNNTPAIRTVRNIITIVQSILVYIFWFLNQYLSMNFILCLVYVCVCLPLWKNHKDYTHFLGNCIPVINKIFKMLCLIIPVIIRISYTDKSRFVKLSKNLVTMQDLVKIGNENFFMARYAANIYLVFHCTNSTNLPIIFPLAPIIFYIFSSHVFLIAHFRQVWFGRGWYRW
jgi:hypothetical protein